MKGFATMPGPTDNEIRTRAFELWEDAGRPDGEMDRFWYAAKEELLLQRGDGLLINYREMTHLIS
jgi:hypothetical protein